MDASKDETDSWLFPKKEELKEGENVAPEPFADFYNMAHPQRGIAVIFNQVNFTIRCSKREGSDKDRDDLRQLLSQLNFDVKVYNDLSVAEITAVLKKVSKMDHTLNDCLVITVMTHGDNGILYGNDGSYPTNNEGYYSWRDPSLGTYFIQALVHQLKNLYDQKDLLTILTFVNRQVAINFTSEEPTNPKFSGNKQMCSVVSMLTRILQFDKK